MKEEGTGADDKGQGGQQREGGAGPWKVRARVVGLGEPTALQCPAPLRTALHSFCDPLSAARELLTVDILRVRALDSSLSL